MVWLCHAGKKGMKWGVRHEKDNKSSGTGRQGIIGDFSETKKQIEQAKKNKENKYYQSMVDDYESDRRSAMEETLKFHSTNLKETRDWLEENGASRLRISNFVKGESENIRRAQEDLDEIKTDYISEVDYINSLDPNDDSGREKALRFIINDSHEQYMTMIKRSSRENNKEEIEKQRQIRNGAIDQFKALKLEKHNGVKPEKKQKEIDKERSKIILDEKWRKKASRSAHIADLWIKGYTKKAEERYNREQYEKQHGKRLEFEKRRPQGKNR